MILRKRTIPSVYSENLLDSLDAYALAIEEGEREWILDSIYNYENMAFEQGKLQYQEEGFSDDQE